jgi:hypothetical protein
MVPTAEIVWNLVKTGYLAESRAEAAQHILASALRDEYAVAARAEALGDEAQQEQMITGARKAAELDAVEGDERELSIDQSIIQDAIGKEQVDESTRRHAEKKIAAACKSAAKSLAHARLIDRSQVKDVASLIQETWLESSD